MNANTSLKELSDLGVVSSLLCKICNSMRVETIEDLLNYHSKNGSFVVFLSRRGIFLQLVCLYSRVKCLENEITDSSLLDIEDYSPVGSKDLPSTYQLSTSIDEMFATGGLSVRAYYGCASSCLYTLSDIVCYKQKNGNFDSISKLGKKSVCEIERIIEEYGYTYSSEDVDDLLFKKGLDIARGFNVKFLSELWKQLSLEVETASCVVKKYLLDSFPSAELYYAEMYARKGAFQDVEGFSFDENIELYKIYERIASEILIWFSNNMVIKSVYMECFIIIQRNLKLELAKIEDEKYERAMLGQFNSFSNDKKEYIENKYKTFCEKRLSVRAQKMLPVYFGNIQTIIHWFNGSKDVFVLKYAKTKHSVTFEEIFDCIQEFKVSYWKLAKYSKQQIVSEGYSDVFPFLSSHQRDFVVNFLKEKGHLPLFFILLQYIKNSEEKNLQQYSMYYRLKEDRCWTTEEIAKRYDCTKERVRQNIRGTSVLEKCQIKSPFDWSIYDFSNNNVVSENSSIYKRIKEEECLKCEFISFVALLRLVLPYELVQIEESYFAVCEDVLNLCELSRFVKDVQKALEIKTTSVTVVSVLDYVQSRESVNNRVLRQILSAAAVVVLESLNVKMDNDGVVTIYPQKLDKEKAIVQVLETANAPLPLEELLELLEKKYPDEYWTADKVRFYASRSSEVAALGKSKIYALKKWDDVFFGNIREYLVHVLESSEVPMHIDSLYEKVVKQFPDTNAKSLSSTMNNDQYHRFSAFENGFFGLSDRQYDDGYILMPSEQRFSFEQRLQMFQDFVETYKRFPVSSSGELEGSLYRWYSRVSKGRVQTSIPQKQAFDNYLEECSRNKYPQTGLEVVFFENCNRVKEIILSNHRLPTKKDEPEVFNWLYKYKEKYEIYDDQRKDYYCELLKFIQSYGFIL